VTECVSKSFISYLFLFLFLFLFFIIRVMKKKSSFILCGKKTVLNKTRNIYIREKAKGTLKTKTRYIKYKGEFVKLKSFVKEKEINSKKNKIYRKEEKGVLYFFYAKGGGLKDDVKFYYDYEPARNTVKQIAQIKTVINTLIDTKIRDKYYNICNLVYTYNKNGNKIYIKPLIIVKEGHNIIFKFYFTVDAWKNPTNNNEFIWIDIPIHITQFFSHYMKYGSKESKDIWTHIHITAEMDKLQNYRIISSRNDLQHIYLMAGSIGDVSIIIKNHWNYILNNWKKVDFDIPNRGYTEFPTYYLIKNNRWNKYEKISKVLNPDTDYDHSITEGISSDLADCINTKLYRIIIDILKYIEGDKTIDITTQRRVIPTFSKRLDIDIFCSLGRDDIVPQYTQPSQLPVRPSQSPVRPSQSPVRPSKSPRRPSKSPVRPSKSPVRPSKSPVRPSKSPQEKATKRRRRGKRRKPLDN
jgi:hypothetical protein